LSPSAAILFHDLGLLLEEKAELPAASQQKIAHSNGAATLRKTNIEFVLLGIISLQNIKIAKIGLKMDQSLNYTLKNQILILGWITMSSIVLFALVT
jgi:hypothetical protein